MTSLSRLHPHLQHAIVHDLGWRSLRPVQEMAVDAILDGCNAVVLAPTAGGKTEASMFPVLSRILSEDLRPVSALYVCPIRALLNNQEERLRGYARMVGLDVFKWHGDVADSRKQRFKREPTHVLMTTPESLEVMMMSERTDARALFAGLSTIVIDEVHAFAADDRGAHLASLIERLVAITGTDIQRIGLSATVGNPRVIGEWLQGSSAREFRLVDPPKVAVEREIRIERSASIEDAARSIGRLGRGKKSLVFVESRGKAESVAHALSGTGVEVFIHHSSVSRQDRALAEDQFARGQNTAIVCTSTMELGIDVGDLDQVIQVDAPATVASFLQRLGRTGRRAGTRARCTFFCLSGEALLQSVAIVRLAQRGWVEDVQPATHAIHVLAHQVMALSLQERGISRHRVMGWVEAAYPFASVRGERVKELIDTMVEREILYEADGLLSLGRRGEKLYGRKNFFELYAVFTAPPILRVMWGKDEVGHLQASFVTMHGEKAEAGPLCFRLAGRAWQVELADWSKGVLHVKPAEFGRVPSWLGAPGLLSRPVCAAMWEVLGQEGEEGAWLGAEASGELSQLRESYAGLVGEGEAPLEDQGEGVQWHTFAGGAVNRLLAAGLERATGKRWTSGNLSLKCKEVGLVKAKGSVGELASSDWEVLASEVARGFARGMLSKFQPCLPEDAEARLLVERLVDVAGVMRFVANTRVHGRVIAAGGRRLKDEAAEGAGDVRGLEGVVQKRGVARPDSEVIWVDDIETLRAIAAELQEAEVIGLDVETGIDTDTLCLMQLAVSGRTFVVDTLALGEALAVLAPVLAGEVPKVIHHARFERRVLAKVDLELRAVFDTLEASRRLRGVDVLGGHSLAMVCERELGVSLDKSAQTSNWARRPLDPEQVAYAALDAEVLLTLHRRFAELLSGDG